MKDSHFTPLVDPAGLLAIVDKALFEEYKLGAQLCVWRNSSPHNWWLGEPGERDAIVYHWKQRARPGQAFFQFGRKLPSTGPVVSYGGAAPLLSRNDEGLPQSDTWVYDEARYQVSVDLWATAKACAKSFNEHAGSMLSSVSALDPIARGVAMKLKRNGLVPMYGRLQDAATVLVKMGLALVAPTGYLVPTPLLLATPVPREKLAG
jgi:hypothetical protein